MTLLLKQSPEGGLPLSVTQIALSSQMGTVYEETLFRGHKYLLYSHFLCPRTQLFFKWVPSPAKPSSVGINICSPATFCAQERSSCQNGYRLRGNSLPWAQISFLHHPPIKIPLAKSAHQNLSHLTCVALPHTFSISATRSTPKKLRSSSFLA